MPRFVAISVVACCLAALLATPSFAQYMYLDANGNGLSDPGDAVNAVGVPTTVDLYLISNRNRDGSQVECNRVEPYVTAAVAGYAVNLLAADGTVAYSNYINRQPDRFSIRFNEFNPDGVRYQTGFSASVPRESGLWLPAGGPHWIATLTVTAQTGSPRIDIVEHVSGGLDATWLAIDCVSPASADFIWYLGIDWFDVDGLRPGGTGGNRPPLVSQPADMILDAGEFASQEVGATDPELQTLALTLRNAPEFALLSTTDSEPGTARGVVHLSPRAVDVGDHGMTLAVTDGALEDARSFRVTVRPGTNHPPTIGPIPPLAVVAGRLRREAVFAGDPDGGELQLAKSEGPAFATFRQLRSGEGGAVGELQLAPSLCEIGPATVVIAASDGAIDTRVEVPIQVLPPGDPPGSLHVPFEAGGQHASDVVLTDLNRDGSLDAVVSFEFSDEVSVHLGNGTGSLALHQRVASGPGGWSLQAADFNADGWDDVAVTNSSGASVSVLLGNGDGTLQPGIGNPVGTGPHGLRTADLNSDGRTDLVASYFGGGMVSVLLGKGDGTFEARMDVPAGSAVGDFVVADFDIDGRPDVAATVAPRALVTLLGTGSGALRPGPVLPLAYSPDRAATGDWDRNGFPDLAVYNYGAGALQTYRGDGEGGFEPSAEFGTYLYPATVEAADFDQDGETDLALLESGPVGLGLFRGLPGGGFAAPPLALAPAGYYNFDSGDMNGDGLRDFVLVAGTGGLVVFNDGGGRPPLEARGFLAEEHRTTPSANASSRIAIRLEPVAGAFAASDLDPATVRLSRTDIDSPVEISPLVDKATAIGDTDRNGIPEIPIWFARTDWARLFEDIHGRQTAGVGVDASLVNGRRLCARFEVSVVGTGGSAAADSRARALSVSIAPNPLNPAGTIRFTTTREGFARVRVCDVRGRLVRSLLDVPSIPAGEHEKLFDGRGDDGEPLASGVYFYHLETGEGTLRGRITVLK